MFIKKHRTTEEKISRLETLKPGEVFRPRGTTFESAIAGKEPLYIVANNDSNQKNITIVSLDGKSVMKRDPTLLVIYHEKVVVGESLNRDCELSNAVVGETFKFQTLTGEEDAGVYMKLAPIGPEKPNVIPVFSFQKNDIESRDSAHIVQIWSYTVGLKEAEPA